MLCSPSPDKPGEIYVPRIFGYKINRDSPYYLQRRPAVKAKGSADASPIASKDL